MLIDFPWLNHLDSPFGAGGHTDSAAFAHVRVGIGHFERLFLGEQVARAGNNRLANAVFTQPWFAYLVIDDGYPFRHRLATVLLDGGSEQKNPWMILTS